MTMTMTTATDGATRPRRRGAAAVLAAAALAPAACTGGGGAVEEGPTPWETKSRSVMGREEQRVPLPAPSPRELHRGPELRADAVELLLAAVESPDPLLRANAIEALQQAPDHLGPALRLGLRDQNRGVRFVAAMSVGELRRAELVPVVEPLRGDSSRSVRAAAIYALRRCGRAVDPTPLAALVNSQDAEVKANAAMILGALGDRSALPLLREAVHRPLPQVTAARQRIINLQIAEAMVRLGDPEQLEVIRAALFAPGEQKEITVLACQLCGRLADVSYIGPLGDIATRRGIRREPVEVRLAAVQALAQINAGPVPIEIVTANLAHEQDSVRAQAAATLGWFHDPAVLSPLAAMLRDRSPEVQLASAGAILRVTGR